MIDAPDKQFFRPDQVAYQLSVKVRTVYRWIHKGELVAFRLPSGVFRIKKADLNSFIVMYKTSRNNTEFTVSH